jgi:type IV secretion system protein VirB6
MGDTMTNGIFSIVSNMLDQSVATIQRLLDMPLAGLGDFLYYALVYKFVQGEIRSLGPEIMGRMMGIAAGVALTLMTIWIFFQGYRILTGQSRESLAAFVLSVARATLIVMVATSMALFGRDIHEIFTVNMANSVTQIVTGDYDDPTELIEQNMAFTQLAISSIDLVQVSESNGSLNLSSEKTRAMWMAGFGAAGPAVTAGAILLLFEVAMALFIGFGPMFILFLLSDQTKTFFWKWLWHGIGTLFSLGVFVAMTSIVLDVMVSVAASFWVTAGAGALMGQNLTDGMTTVSMQQGGIGLLMTLLLISAPPVAANFFQGAIGSVNPNSVFGFGGARAGATPGQSGYRPDSSPPQNPGAPRDTNNGGSLNQNPQLLTGNQTNRTLAPDNSGPVGTGAKRADASGNS